MNSATGLQEIAAAGIRYQLFINHKSQGWLANKLGWDKSKLARRLANNPSFKISELDSICSKLGIGFEELMDVPAEYIGKTSLDISENLSQAA